MTRRALLTGVALAGAAPAAHATVLDFTGVATNEPINASYGDRVITTPNVVTDFSPLGDNGWQGYDEATETYDGRDWFGVAQLDGDGTAYDITFTPDPGFGVRVNSFEFDDYANYPDPPAGHTFDWLVFAGSPSNVLASGSETVPSDSTPDTSGADNYLVLTGMTDFHPGPVTLRIMPTGGDAFDRAIDDVSFDQAEVVPEPAGLGLVGLPAGLLLRRRHRRA